MNLNMNTDKPFRTVILNVWQILCKKGERERERERDAVFEE